MSSMPVACKSQKSLSTIDSTASVTPRSLVEAEALDLADPLRHLLTATQVAPLSASTKEHVQDVRDLPSTQDYSVVPTQLESIIDRRIVIRYFRDGNQSPLLFEPDETPDSTSDQDSKSLAQLWDVSLKLDMTNGCGGKIWPAAEVLGAYIASHYSDPLTSTWHGKTIVELGSGTGLVGFLVAKLGLRDTKVFVTDQIPMLSLMRENQQLNALPTSADTAVAAHTTTVEVEELNWGQTIPAAIPLNPDVLLLADCVYLESAFEPLVRTMTELATGSTATEILFCYQKRRKADKRFFIYLKKQFTFKEVDDDDPQRTNLYRRQGTQLLRVYKK